jgi:hypothetical protein
VAESVVGLESSDLNPPVSLRCESLRCKLSSAGTIVGSRRLRRRGPWLSNLWQVTFFEKLVPPCHNSVAVVHTHPRVAWRFMARRFFVSESAAGADVTRCFGFVGTVIAGSAIAAPPAVNKPGSNNDAAPITVTSRVPKYGSTIETGNENIAAGERKVA